MKKYFLYSIFLLCLNSCEENVKFNNPAFQGVKNNIFWKAANTTASISTNGALTLNAYTIDEQLTLKTDIVLVKKYPLSISNTNAVLFKQTNTTTNLEFATDRGIGDGEIVITEYDKKNQTISGTFRFNAPNTSTNQTVEPSLNFEQGIFYKVSIQP